MTELRDFQPSAVSAPTSHRHRKEADRFRRSVEAMVRSHRGFVTLGHSQVITDLAAEFELDETDYCQFEIKQKGREVCLVFVPQRHWHNTDTMQRFKALGAAAGAIGRQVALVPESLVRRTTRVGRLDDHAAELDLEVSGNDRMAVISFLSHHGSGKLSELAGMLEHPNPVAAVLRLATLGAVHVDLDARILPASLVNLPAAAH